MIKEPFPIMSLAEGGVTLYDCMHKTPQPSIDGLGYPYMAIPDIQDCRIDLTNVRRISESDFQEWTRKLRPQGGDIIVTRRGRVGDTAVVPEGLNCAIGQNLVILRSEKGIILQEFLRWVLRSPQYWVQVEKYLNVGSVFYSLNCADIPKFQLPVPPLTEQKRIAEILGALDDKIELNRRMNRTLEAMARALFQSWFVDFDPVHAKARGETPYGMDEATAALFPDSFEETAVGRVPRGWGVSTIGEEVKVVGGSTPSTKVEEYWNDGEIWWATPKDLSKISVPVLLETERQITTGGLSQIGSGLLPRGTILMSSRAPVGYLAYSDIPVAINQGFIGMVCNKVLSNFYILLWAHVNMDRIKAQANGTTFQEVSKSNFRPLPIIVPTPEVINKFNRVIESLFDQIISNERESRSLATLRDTLLPKLVSGETNLLNVLNEVNP